MRIPRKLKKKLINSAKNGDSAFVLKTVERLLMKDHIAELSKLIDSKSYPVPDYTFLAGVFNIKTEIKEQ